MGNLMHLRLVVRFLVIVLRVRARCSSSLREAHWWYRNRRDREAHPCRSRGRRRAGQRELERRRSKLTGRASRPHALLNVCFCVVLRYVSSWLTSHVMITTRSLAPTTTTQRLSIVSTCKPPCVAVASSSRGTRHAGIIVSLHKPAHVPAHVLHICGRSASAADPRLGTRETLRVLEQLVSELLGRAQRHLLRFIA